MSDVAAFLRARLDDDMESAGFLHVTDCDHPEDPFACRCDCGVPQRVLREVEAKRRILSWTVSAEDYTWYILASVYSDHPDYDPDWAISRHQKDG